MLASGTRLHGRYAIERVVAEGGMGTVYRARRTDLDQVVAIKAMTVEAEGSERRAASAQFNTEAELLSGLDHSGLVKVVDHFEENGVPYLVMEYVDGVTLDAVLNEMPTLLPVAQVLAWLKQAAEVLVYLHGRPVPIVLRDLKPGNLMVDQFDRIHVIDFGIAQLFHPHASGSEFLRERGSPGFAPPEQYGDGRGIDPRSDIYALGATAYALLTRTVPPPSVELAAGRATLSPPRMLHSRVPQELEECVLHMMALDKEHRYARASDCLSTLRGIAKRLPRDGSSQFSVMMKCNDCGLQKVRGSQRCFVCHPELRHAPPVTRLPVRGPGGAVEDVSAATLEWSGSRSIADIQTPAVPVVSRGRGGRVWLLVAGFVALLALAGWVGASWFGEHGRLSGAPHASKTPHAARHPSAPPATPH